MKDASLPVATKNQHYEFTLTIGDTPESAAQVVVSFDGFPTLGHLLQTLIQIQASNVTQLAAAYILAESQEEYDALMADLNKPPEQPTAEQIQAAGDALLASDQAYRAYSEGEPTYIDGATGEVVDADGNPFLRHLQPHEDDAL